MRSPNLRIRLLGTFDLRRGVDEPAVLESTRAASLLAYLALHPDVPRSRQHLAFLLWPDSSETQARTNLRHVFHILRRAIPDFDSFVDVTPQALRWRADAPCWLDVAQFRERLATAQQDQNAALHALRQAVDLYGGDLLEGHYDEWLLGERELLRHQYRDALMRLVQLLEERGDLDEALPVAARLLQHDPLDEASYRILMRLHDASGNRARAARIYHECVATLERELGVEPSEQTLVAYQALLPREHDVGAQQQESRRPVGPPLVGRRAERERLTALLRAAERGQPRFVLLSGEAGVGKTRLVEELASWCVHRGACVAEARSYSAEGSLVFGQVVAWLRSPAIYSHLERLDPAVLTDVTRLLPELISEFPGVRPPEPLPMAEHRQRLYDALTQAILMRVEPLLLVADDLQWCDAESLQFVHYLMRTEPQARLLIAGAARMEEIDQLHPLRQLINGLQSLDRYTEIPVGRLTRTETGLLAERLADRSVHDEDAERLFRETEGNPLFVVEAVRAGWTGAASERLALSPRVKSVIEARLSHLTKSAREMLGFAATFGGAFTADMLTLAAEANERAVVLALDELWRRHIVQERGADGYDFTHDKIREVAYESLSPAVRRGNHARAALVLEQLHAAEPGAVSGQIASHYERAGISDRAVDWYERAAETALRLHANAEAVHLLRRGVELLRSLPETPERQARELALLTALPSPLVALEGYQSPYVSEVHSRALALATRLSVEPAPPLLWSLSVASLSRGDFDAARMYGRQLQARGERDGDDILVVQSGYLLGIAAFWNGEFDASRSHFEFTLERFRPQDRQSHILHYGQDPTILCQMRLALALWFLGRTSDALRTRDEALARATAHDHRYSRLTALIFAGLFAVETGERDRLQECVDGLAGVLAEAEPTHTRIGADMLAGYADVLDGRSQKGIARIERWLDHPSVVSPAPGTQAMLARILLAARRETGDSRAGLEAATRLLESSDGVRTWDAEAHRMHAEFHAALGASHDAVEAELDLALQIARRQQARLLELRAATSLLRYRRAHGDAAASDEARATLAGLLAAIPDGADAADLREAESLLSAS